MTKAISLNSYPFGSAMPTRGWSDASRQYRYGFNGKEKDFETANDDYDFGARIYDGRLGRWLSLDPLIADYPGSSNYIFAHSSPISLIDPSGKNVIIGNMSSFNSGGPQVLTNSAVVSSYINQFASKQNGSQAFYAHTVSQSNGVYSRLVHLSFTSVDRNSPTGINMIAANQDAQTTFTYSLDNGTVVAANAYVPVAGVNISAINANIQVLSDNLVQPINVGDQSVGNQAAMGAATTALAIINQLYSQVDVLTNLLNANSAANNGQVNLNQVAQQFTALLNGPPLPISAALPAAVSDVQTTNASSLNGFFVQYDQVDELDNSNTARCRTTSSVRDIINSNNQISPIVNQSYVYPVASGLTNIGGGTRDTIDYIPTPDKDRDANSIKCQ